MHDQLIITGKFLGAGQVESFGQNNFLSRKFWVDLTTNPEYPNTPEFKLVKDNVYLVDKLTKGTQVKVYFRLDGRKYDNQQTGKKGVITNIVVYKIEVVTTQSAAALPSAAPAPAQPVAQARPVATAAPLVPAVGLPGEFQHAGQQGDDDLPF